MRSMSSPEWEGGPLFVGQVAVAHDESNPTSNIELDGVSKLASKGSGLEPLQTYGGHCRA